MPSAEARTGRRVMSAAASQQAALERLAGINGALKAGSVEVTATVSN